MSNPSNKSKAQEQRERVREICEADLYSFAQFAFPDRYYGDVHKDFFHFLQHNKADCKLGLIPRDHQKSHCAAVLCAWLITKQPWVTINYVSANARLVEAQMRTIKHVLQSPHYRDVWPEMLNYVKDRGEIKHKPEGVWTQVMFEVDHPARKKRGVRDATVTASTVRGTNTGLHADVTIYDDLVTDENYQSAAEKEEVINCYKNFAKIATTGSKMYAVGTRYGDDDLYAMMKDIEVVYFDDDDKEVREARWSIFEKVVEDSPHRTGDGNFVWPRAQHPKTGDWFGFDRKELAKKKADLSMDGNMTSFYAQYYNDPNDASLQRLNKNHFKYYDPSQIQEVSGQWYVKGKLLKVFAAADLAFTEGNGNKLKRRDYTALCVIGIDPDGYIYLLAMDRFQTDKMEVYYDRIMELYDYWGFKKIVVETNNGGKLVKAYVEDQIRREGGLLEVEGKAHTSHDGKKEERIMQALEPRYRSGTIIHFKGGLIKILEEELVLNRPPHRDMKDVLAICIENSKSPMKRANLYKSTGTGDIIPLSRFGGRRRKK